MQHCILTDKNEIERYLRRDAALHLYELGDLDEFFWPHTRWFGLKHAGRLDAAALLYSGDGLPVLLALASGDQDRTAALLAGIAAELPARFYCHLTPGLEAALGAPYRLEPHGRHHKMVLAAPRSLRTSDGGEAERLRTDDGAELTEFYGDCYPGNWFDPRMLESGEYFAIRRNGRIASAAGVHVHSPTYRVAALGNIATRRELRGQGLGRAVTAALCRDLLATTDLIGLNVKADNAAAIACYTGLGFVPHAEYDEWTAERWAPGTDHPA